MTQREYKEAVCQIKLAILEALMDNDSRDVLHYTRKWIELETEFHNDKSR